MQLSTAEGIIGKAAFNDSKPWIPFFGEWIYEDDNKNVFIGKFSN
jgi:hypothetical protein